ncbi:cystathionine beta-lyase [Pilibacter termitis]|uniref:homocysteine desulfhydrase n=1 Tax=Pilibacter termitis TaxID=263852 RepID=A0A1T4QCY1_9ENTE|nr:PLP-dependent aspartate aminotransferase family protein [Pilibacter termitis]SKA01476.1 cystathionine beta-lyase [Pilibacter termitis]
MKLDTFVVTGISSKETPHNAVTPPIYLTSTYEQEGLDEFGEYQYSRASNPTRTHLEKLVAGCENARFALAYSSGMAASSAFFSLFQPKDKVLFNSEIYGGTYAFVQKYFQQYGIEYELVENLNEYSLEDFDENVKGIFIETPSNPLLRVSDIQKISDLAHQKGIVVAVDNTFLTPYYQKPLALGADVVVYSATKYFGGHADAIGGLITTNNETLHEKLRFFQINQGAILSPFECYSFIRGIKTLSVRLDRQTENTKAIVAFLQHHKDVENVYFAGSANKAEREIQERQASGIGALISFSLKETIDLDVFLKALQRFDLAASLGGVESLIEHIGKMSHQSFSEEELKILGISNRHLRLAIGIENKEDLIEDLAQALEKARLS